MRRINVLRRQAYTASALIVTLAVLAPLAYSESQPTFSELPNFYRVNEHLYRGGQPRAGGIKKLCDLGIKTVVNLRGEDDLSRSEQAEAARYNIRYFNIPMAGIGRPSDSEMSAVMGVIDAPENWPVFVHCKRGSDRTGTVVACYRISHDRWDTEKATAEARKFGMSWVEAGMKSYISDYYRSHLQTGAMQPAQSTQRSNP